MYKDFYGMTAVSSAGDSPVDSLSTETSLHRVPRMVHKDGCFILKGTKYAAGVVLAGQLVEVIYDPADTSSVRVSYHGSDPVRTEPVRIGETCEAVKKAESEVPAGGSRYLRAVEKEYQKYQKYQKEDN